MKKRWIKISDLLSFQEGPGVRNTQYTTSGVKLLNVANLVDGKVDLSTSERYISEEEAYGKYKHFLCDKGDFVVASSGIKVEYIDKKMGFIDESMLPLCMNTSTIRFKVLDPSVLRIRYFMYYLKSQSFKEQLTRYITGSAQLNYGPSHIKQMVMPWIPLVSQDKLIERLDRVQVIIDYKEQKLTCLDKLVKSRFVEMFGEPVTNSKGYPIHQLSDHILFLTSGSRGWAQYYTDKGEWFITIKNVKDCRISVDDVQCINPPKNAEAERTRLREGDLLISITADLGRTGVVTKEIAEHGAYNNQHLTCIRLDRLALDPLYVAFFMESEAGKRQFEAKNMSAVKAGLNFDSIRSLRLIVPPLTLQKEFTAFVAEVDKSKLAVKQSLEKLETLKKSLMQQYFG